MSARFWLLLIGGWSLAVVVTLVATLVLGLGSGVEFLVAVILGSVFTIPAFRVAD